MKPLPLARLKYWELIKANMNETGMPPTRAEIAQKRLQVGQRGRRTSEGPGQKGVIEIMPGTSRGIRLLLEEEDVQPEENGLPLIGKVAAGEPILARNTSRATTRWIPPCSTRGQTSCCGCRA